jgi:hypothetical protein
VLGLCAERAHTADVDSNPFRTTRLAVAALALAGGLVVITACGDDDDMHEPMTSTMTSSSMMTEASTP